VTQQQGGVMTIIASPSDLALALPVHNLNTGNTPDRDEVQDLHK